MRSWFGGRAVFAALFAIAIAAAIGVMAYNAGVAHGLAEGGRLAGAPAGAVPYVYMARPWGFGFFPFFPFLFVLLWFVVLRGLFWGRGWHPREGGVPRRFEEWHRRAHEQDASKPAAGTTT